VAQRFIVGIDLGTTNSALSWVDLEEGEAAGVHLQPVPQLVNPGEVSSRTLLPSFLYSPGAMDFPAGSTALPWDPAPRFVAGELARRRGAESPTRLVASAKSWLSYGGANRTGPILPWGAPEEVAKVSPVDAAAEYLRHLAAAFDSEIANGKKALALAKQDILLTVPASFDEEARELTLRAAQAAGLPNVTLL
jgi:molecular chaperone DnaK (HSP70)